MARGKGKPRRRFWLRLRSWLLRGLLLLVLVSVALVLPWRWLEPPTTAFIEIDRARYGYADAAREWVALDAISNHLAIAVVASEDQKFPSHYGFDFASIRDALAARGQGLRGASTISQQVAKNLFLWPGRSFLRKGIEAWLTVWIEALWPKRRILEVYLNVAEFAPGVFGAGAAARHHFGVPAAALDLHQATLLAAVLPNPKRMSASRPSPYVHRRAAEIEAWVHQLGGSRYLGRL